MPHLGSQSRGSGLGTFRTLASAVDPFVRGLQLVGFTVSALCTCGVRVTLGHTQCSSQKLWFQRSDYIDYLWRICQPEISPGVDQYQ